MHKMAIIYPTPMVGRLQGLRKPD